MQLMQQPVTGTAQNLPAHDNTMDTGPMGCCVSVIVLWNPNAAGVYQNVRGFHGGGGAQAVNYASLIAGVPAHATTQVFVFNGPDNRSDLERRIVNREVRNNILVHLHGIQVRIYHGIASATVDRSAQVTLTSYER